MAECQGACSGNKAGAEETETYLLDFTRPYHNLLGIENGNSRKTFYWDGNVIGMEEQNHTPALPETALQTDGNVLTTGNVPTTGNIPTAGMHYYLLDELGSPRRVNGYEEGDKSAYLTYGYDEFGNDLYEDLEEAGIPNPYSRQGEEQPFGYTGYRYDNISHSYFAQAREYQPENGRFNAEDVIKGNGAFPETLNHYGYCLNNPMGYVDLNGMEPTDGSETDYVGVYYLNSEDGAYTFGHAAVLFVRADGSGTFYSFAATSEAANIVAGNYVEGYLSKAELASNDVERFFGAKVEGTMIEGKMPGEEVDLVEDAGKIWTDGIDCNFFDGEKTPYTRAVYIPITAEEGRTMTNYAEYLRDHDGEYNLYARNCSMVAQDILSRGFAAGSGNGKNIDEQLTMVNILANTLSNIEKSAKSPTISLLLLHILKDYGDQTVPDAAYYSGCIQVELSLYKEGWEYGELEQFQNKDYGGNNCGLSD